MIAVFTLITMLTPLTDALAVYGKTAAEETPHNTTRKYIIYPFINLYAFIRTANMYKRCL